VVRVPPPEIAEGLPYQLADELTGDERYRLYRSEARAGARRVLLKVPARSPVPAEDVAGLKREYEILRQPPIEAATRALDLICDDRFCALVLEDRDEVALASLIPAQALSIGWVLDYALQIVAALAGLHRAGIVHRALSPRAVLVRRETGRIRLTDFADAAHNAAIARLPLPRHQYRMRLPYAAPEQTGRVNRSPDYRTDFYALGAVLYELLAGRPPFVVDDPLELIHAHLARQPVAPSDLSTGVPLPLSDIVMKLLAKQPEERYQSARALADDLDRCRREWSERGRIAQFPLAARDVSDSFNLANRIFGREAERAALRAAYDHARAGATRFVVVEGPAGIGKTALIREMQGSVARERGHFVGGKFDQLSRDVPYGALSQALRERVQHALDGAAAQRASEGDRLARELGANAAVIAELVPELEDLLGKQPPVPWLPPAEAHNRFTVAFRNFLAALATRDAPLVVFLDDLQWADASTLQLLTALLVSPGIRHLLVIGACRDMEPTGGQPVATMLGGLAEAGVPLQRIALAPLDLAVLEQFARAALQRDDAESAALARVLADKTLGNPLFVTQFLVALHQDGLIAFDREHWRWVCRMEAIANMAITANVVDLLSRKLDRLPPSIQRVLTLAAIVGNRFDAQKLATVSELPLRSVLDALDAAAGAGLIKAEPKGAFAFLHDRVQQAAYGLVDEADRPGTHLLVGRLLWGEHAEDGSDIEDFDGIFETASHLNLGAHLIGDDEERVALARLNLAAGQRAKAAAAYQAALGYFRAGLDLIGAPHWATDYPLAFELHLEVAQCEYLCGNFETAAARFEALVMQELTHYDRARVASLRAIQHENMGRFDRALASAREALALLGLELPEDALSKERSLDAELEVIESAMAGTSIASLIDRPAMTDRTTRLVMRILTDSWSPAYILGDATLARLISATLVRLSLTHGNAEESAYGYVTHAITAGPVKGDYAAAWEWGSLALAVNKRFDDRRLRAKIYQQFHAHVGLWRQPFARCVEHAREACRIGLENGDFLYAAYGASTSAWPGLAAAQDLSRFIKDFEGSLPLLAQLKNPAFADALRLMLGWARALISASPGAVSLTGLEFDEAGYVATYRDNPFFSMFHAIARLHVCFTLEDMAGAANAAAAVHATAAHLSGMLWSVQFQFWNGMRLAVQFAEGTEAQRAQWRAEIVAAHQTLAALGESCPENYRCFALLLDAELARIAGQTFDALQRYESAVAFADHAQDVQQQALANERCGRFWLDRGNRRIATIYMRAAVDCYRRWGAEAKVRHLLARYGSLLEMPDDTSTGAARGRRSDLSLPGEGAPADLHEGELGMALRRILAIAIQNSGASRGVLLEVRGEDLTLIAEGGADRGATQLLASDLPLAWSTRCSRKVVDAAVGGGSPVLVADPAEDPRFGTCEYFTANRPRSVLCVAALYDGRPAAVLYLEHLFARDAFGSDRVDLVQILAAQAVLALTGARTLEQVKQEMAGRRRAEQQLRAIDEGLASVTGRDFFRVLVRNVARALQVRYAFVAECLPAVAGEGRIARACAFWNGEDFGPNFEYALPGTPCQQVVEGRICHFGSNLQAQFPADRALVRWEAQSYVGMPLVGSNDEVIGHFVVLDTQPMPDATLAIAVLRLSAGRAGAELERMKADARLQQALSEVEQLKNKLQEENVYLRRELIANVSHDLRSPLASLRGYLDTLLLKEKTLREDERHSYLSIAARQAEQLQTLISELFDLARLDFTGYRIAAEPLQLGELARDVLQKFQLAARKQGVRLQLVVDDAIGFVQADIGLIERTLENLLGNALAHTPRKGRVQLGVRANGDGVTVEVSDTGTGIPGADLPHIFERFYRVDKARSLSSAGSGLGLAIVKRIVELHASEIRVESEVGVGTRFWFTLRSSQRPSALAKH
jgi:predicted ATPase/signal transduction histidine kinase